MKDNTIHEDGVGFLRKAKRDLEKQQYKDAIQTCKDWLEYNKEKVDNVDINLILAHSHWFLAELEEAVFYYKKVIGQKDAPTKISEMDMLLCEGNVFYYDDQHEQALEKYKKALSLTSNNIMALVGKGNTLRYLGKYEDAHVSFDEALIVDKNNTWALVSKGLAYVFQGETKDALRYIEQALAIEGEGKTSRSLKTKGFALLLARKFNDALEYYDKALEVNPGYVEALVEKGGIIWLQGDYRQSLEIFESAKRILTTKEFNLVEVLACQSITYSFLGHHERAMDVYKEMLQQPKMEHGEFHLKQKIVFILNLISDEGYIEAEIQHRLYKHIARYLSYIKGDALNVIRWITHKAFLSEIIPRMLDENPENYFQQALNSTLEKDDNKHYNSYKYIYKLLLEIVDLLYVDSDYEESVAHYTTKHVASQLLFVPTNFRLYPTLTSNDPKEGKSIFDFLGSYNPDNNNDTDYLTFIGCFTFSHEKLNQFRLYGKDNGKEATGVSIVVNKHFFNNTITEGQPFGRNKHITNKERYPLFRCIYVDTLAQRVISVGHKEEEDFYKEERELLSSLKKEKNTIQELRRIIQLDRNIREYEEETQKIMSELNQKFRQLRNYIKSNGLSKDAVVAELLNILRFFIKDSAYKEEQECRIVIRAHINQNKNIAGVEEGGLHINYLPMPENGNVKKVYFATQAYGYELFAKVVKKQGLKIDVKKCEHPFDFSNR